MARKDEIKRKWERTIEYLYDQRPAYERQGQDGYKPGLDTSLALDRMYLRPHKNYRIIHVAGTNGKGSVAHLLASVLQHAGYKTGLFTSPHLVDFRERIRVNGRKISRNFVMDWVNDFRQREFEGNPSFFELTSTMAFDFFAWRNVNVAVIETGLGGRLDSTNIITPDLSIITNIGLEHTQLLGNTLIAIAGEKAGIIKRNRPVLIGEAGDADVKAVFVNKAKQEHASIAFAQDEPEVTAARHADGMLELQTVHYGTLQCELTGDYQVANANTALSAINILRHEGFRIKDPAVTKGFATVVETTGLMGRWMRLADEPLTICDSAHNVPGITQVVKQLQLTPHDKLHIVMGMMADKDVEHALALLPHEACYYFTQAQTTRSLPAGDLRKMAEQQGVQGKAYDNVMAALDQARKAAGSHDLIFIGGSMYVLAELLTAMNIDDKDD